MEEKKLNSEEIVKALKCCGNDHMSCSSENCPLWKHTTCQSQLAREALDFIKRLQCEKKELEDLCNKTYDDLTKEIDRLQSENKQISLVAGIVNKGVAVEIVNMQERIDKQKAEIEHWQDRFKEQVEETDELKAEIERLAEENKQLKEEIDLEVDLQTQRKRQIITESQEFIDELANKNAKLQKQLKELREDVERFDEVANINEKLMIDNDELQKQVDELKEPNERKKLQMYIKASLPQNAGLTMLLIKPWC